jgi:hypothetical protein
MLPGVYPNWLMGTPSVLPEWLGVYRDEIEEGIRLVEGYIVDPWGRPVDGHVTFKRLVREYPPNVYPLEYVAEVVNGYYSIELADDRWYDILVVDQFYETIWNYEAPLNPETPEDPGSITIAEMWIQSGKSPYNPDL